MLHLFVVSRENGNYFINSTQRAITIVNRSSIGAAVEPLPGPFLVDFFFSARYYRLIEFVERENCRGTRNEKNPRRRSRAPYALRVVLSGPKSRKKNQN